VEFLSDEVLRNRIALVDGVEHFLLRKFTTLRVGQQDLLRGEPEVTDSERGRRRGRTVVSESEDNTIASREEDILPMIKIQKLFQISFYGKAVFSVSDYMENDSFPRIVGYLSHHVGSHVRPTRPMLLAHGYHGYHVYISRGVWGAACTPVE